jgi:hypothetical protein
MKERQVKGEGWDIVPMMDVAPPNRRKGEGGRQRSLPTVDWATCPTCHATRKIGLVRSGKHFVWKIHDRTTMSKAKMVCPSSGTAICQTPGRAAGDPTCPHG